MSQKGHAALCVVSGPMSLNTNPLGRGFTEEGGALAGGLAGVFSAAADSRATRAGRDGVVLVPRPRPLPRPRPRPRPRPARPPPRPPRPPPAAGTAVSSTRVVGAECVSNTSNWFVHASGSVHPPWRPDVVMSFEMLRPPRSALTSAGSTMSCFTRSLTSGPGPGAPELVGSASASDDSGRSDPPAAPVSGWEGVWAPSGESAFCGSAVSVR